MGGKEVKVVSKKKSTKFFEKKSTLFFLKYLKRFGKRYHPYHITTGLIIFMSDMNIK
jgi:hypothetical protein